ncbi:MAG: PA14 domain-containing protein, partial [Cyclobacteriaceae bacterium]
GIRYTLYPELGHGTWNKAFNEPDFFSWMLGKNKADIHSFENSTFICSTEGTRLELAEGFKAYQWQFNGAAISGATTAAFYAKNPGTYRARFSRVSNPTEAQWNQWSKPIVLTVANPPVATVAQIGTVVLNDLNGLANARLQSDAVHTHYYWYKNGTLLNLPGQEDDTLKLATIAPTFGNGAYTLVVSDLGCKSAPSAPKHIFFNDSAPVNITDPSNFAGFSTSPAKNTLTWTDASTNEGGFEIWKRKKNNGTSFSAWEIVGITGPNVKTFDDTKVEPNASYQYKIRAVSSTGRSNYVPSGDTGLVVQTVVDTEAPKAPIHLTASARGVQKLFLRWEPSTDNTRIREYHIFYNELSVPTGSSDTTFMLTGMPLNTRYDITVKGVDLSGNLSPASNVVKASTYFSGLYYQHSTGAWTDLDSVNWALAEFTGTVKEFTLSKKTQDDFYNFSFDGYILIDNGGSYQFRMGSDDGSRLWLNESLLINNNGVHELRTVTGAAVNLQAGPHRIYVQFFEYTQSDTLLVEYKGPDTGGAWTKISRDVLRSDESVITAIGPDNGPEDSFIVSVYPNPTTQNNITVQVETIIPDPVQVRLIDPVGRDLFVGIFQAEEISRGILISPAGTMNTGMYVVMVTQGNLRVRQKIIVRR